jgi:cholesterol transport system auxiliary component
MLSTPFSSRSVLAPTLALTLALGGCVSIIPQSKPVQLYRLSQAPAPPTTPAPQGLTVERTTIAFPPDAAGDRLLTVSGQQAAFVSGARWLEPAAVMFDQAVTDAFDDPGAPRLANPANAASATVTLRLAVRRFQVDYDQGTGAAPAVDVAVEAVLIHHGDRAVLAQKVFETRQRASENRVGPIVAAYDVATAQTLGAIRDWTVANAPPPGR